MKAVMKFTSYSTVCRNLIKLYPYNKSLPLNYIKYLCEAQKQFLSTELLELTFSVYETTVDYGKIQFQDFLAKMISKVDYVDDAILKYSVEVLQKIGLVYIFNEYNSSLVFYDSWICSDVP